MCSIQYIKNSTENSVLFYFDGLIIESVTCFVVILLAAFQQHIWQM